MELITKPFVLDELAGRVLFMFQPGEEGHHGARFMLDEGLLDVPPLADGTPSPVTGAFALHITSSLPTGWVSSRGGAIMASADRFLIDVVGRGGHASEPFRALALADSPHPRPSRFPVVVSPLRLSPLKALWILRLTNFRRCSLCIVHL